MSTQHLRIATDQASSRTLAEVFQLILAGGTAEEITLRATSAVVGKEGLVTFDEAFRSFPRVRGIIRVKGTLGTLDAIRRRADNGLQGVIAYWESDSHWRDTSRHITAQPP